MVYISALVYHASEINDRQRRHGDDYDPQQAQPDALASRSSAANNAASQQNKHHHRADDAESAIFVHNVTIKPSRPGSTPFGSSAVNIAKSMD
jgi:hypothetical protein